jgi:hypothetical protein
VCWTILELHAQVSRPTLTNRAGVKVHSRFVGECVNIEGDETVAKKRPNTGGVSKSDAIRSVIAAQPKATLKEIKEKLHAKGIAASDALVNKIKYGRKTKGRKAVARNGHTHASKADAIRAMFAELGRHARPRDIIAQLKKRGTKVTSAQVSMLRRKLPGNGAHGSVTAGVVSLDQLLAAKQLAERLGGIQNARRALDNLARLVDA